MAFVTFREIKRLIHPHYILSILLACSYLVLKKTPSLCTIFFRDGCEFTGKQSEILFFLAVIIVFRTRKQGSVNLIPYLKTACFLTKITNIILYFTSEPVLGLIYSTLCLLHFLLIPEPCYQGPEKLTYFRSKDLEEELKYTKKTWIIEMYTSWNPKCVEFASVFSELSATYGSEKLCFGKVDLSRNPEVADKYRINTTPFSKQLPTIILFENGKEVSRRPVIQSNGKLIPFPLTFETMVNDFDLNNLSSKCQKINEKDTKTKSKDD